MKNGEMLKEYKDNMFSAIIFVKILRLSRCSTTYKIFIWMNLLTYKV